MPSLIYTQINLQFLLVAYALLLALMTNQCLGPHTSAAQTEVHFMCFNLQVLYHVILGICNMKKWLMLSLVRGSANLSLAILRQKRNNTFLIISEADALPPPTNLRSQLVSKTSVAFNMSWRPPAPIRYPRSPSPNTKSELNLSEIFYRLVGQNSACSSLTPIKIYRYSTNEIRLLYA